jgi:hypothetical protein
MIRSAFVGVLVTVGTVAWSAETKPLSVRDIFPATPDNVGAAARERMALPAKPVTPDRLFQIGLGVGVPNLVALEASVQLLKRLQVGVGYGLLPVSGIVPTVALPRSTVTLVNGLNVALDPTATTGLSVLCPFVRYFPTDRPFYFQLTWGLLLSQHSVVSGLTELMTNLVVPGATITADIALTTSIPTLSIGHIFWRRFFFFNVSLGAGFLLSSTSTVSVTAQIPAAVGTLGAAQQAQVQQQLDAGLASAISTLRDRIAILPSLMVSTGVMF